MNTDKSINPLPSWWGTLLGRMSRVTSGGVVITEIDGLRFIAVTMVVTFHIGEQWMDSRNVTWLESHRWLSSAFGQGGGGVQLFFLISGFILALPFARSQICSAPRPHLKEYFARRLTRLEPTYVIAMTVWLLIHLVLKHHEISDILFHYLASITYSHYLFYGQPSTLLFAAWSLEIEAQFYLLTPLLATLLFRGSTDVRRGILVCATLASCIWRWVAQSETESFLGFTLLGQLHFFLGGFILADLFVSGHFRLGQRSMRWDLIAAVLFINLALLDGYQLNSGVHNLIWVCTLSGIGYCSFRGALFKDFLRNRWVHTIGAQCYTIYLFHRLVISLVEKPLLSHLPPSRYLWLEALIVSTAMFAVVIIVCAFLFVYLERPFMRKEWFSEARRWVSGKVFRTLPPLR